MTTLSTDGIRPNEAARDANATRFDVARHGEACWLCDAGIPETRWWIEVTHRGRMVHADERFSRTDSQGAFPIGSECARRIPRAFKLNSGDLERCDG